MHRCPLIMTAAKSKHMKLNPGHDKKLEQQMMPHFTVSCPCDALILLSSPPPQWLCSPSCQLRLPDVRGGMGRVSGGA